MATRGRKPKAPKQDTNKLLDALEFVSLAQRDMGTISQTHCILSDHWAVASDGVLTIAHPIQDDLAACPQTARLLAALRRCGEGVSITQLDSSRLSLKSGALRVSVPCVDLQQVPIVWADPPQAPIDHRFIEACKAISHVASETGQHVSMISLLGKGQSLFATNRMVLLEYWHGLNLPPYWIFPKAAAIALQKIALKLVGFGISERSATFHYENGAWFKTQLYAEHWPNNLDAMFEGAPAVPVPLPPDLFDAVEKLSAFTDTGRIEFGENVLRAINIDNESAEHDVKGITAGPIFSVKQLLAVAPVAKTWGLHPELKRAFVFGENIRGVMAMISKTSISE